MMVIIGLFTLLIASVVSTEEGEMSSTEIEYCCNIVSNMSDCHSACLKFASKCPPAVQNKTEYLVNYCPEIPSILDVCLSNTNLSNSQSKPTPSQQLVACCSTSESQACEDVCIEQLYIGLLDDAAIVAVIEECGPPISVLPAADPIWSCFFNFAADTTETNTDESDEECTDVPPTEEEVTEPTLTITYADWPRLECCSHANSTECKKACQREYSGNRVQGSWEKINLDCIYQPNEDELAICLADIVDQCSPTCTGLEFCQNFNNRPLQLFRNCNGEADNEAKQKYNEWKNGQIQLPLISIQTKNVSTCLPELWQAAACAIYTRPCDPYSHSSLLCKDECLRLMSACSSDSESKTPEEICDIISPSHQQDRCISIGQFTEPASLQSLTNIIHSPCQTDSCQEDAHCIINHNCIGNEDRVCTPYICVKEKILLGKTPSMSVIGTDTVHVTTLPEPGQRCYGFVHEEDNEFGQQTSDLSSEYCRELEQCSLDEKSYDHGTVFNHSDGCNFCTCYHGDLLCTQHSCVEATVVDLGPTPLLSCDCPTLYAPVCTMTGRTLPNWCIAKCLGYSFDQYKIGSCSSNDPCDHSLCPTGTRCVSQRHICLSDNNTVTDCPQYTCENYTSCLKFTSPVCDTDGSLHQSLCDIFFTTKQIDYFGYCQKECNSDRSQKVCGVNGETFRTKCHALQFGVAIDYVGECHEIPSGSHGCDIIKCPGEQYLSSSESCDGPIPPGACCKQCGGLVNAIIDHKGLNYSRNSMNVSINSNNILERMRLHLEILECRLDGYLAIDNTFVFLLMPTNYSSFLNVEICNMESVRLSTLINTRSPILATDPFLYFLVAATPSLAKVQSVPPLVTEAYTERNGCDRATPLLFTFILMVLLNCVLN